MAVRPFDEIFRDFVINGLPASGPHHPHKGDIRDSLNALVAGPFPDNRVIKLNNANEGTENNIVVSASVAIPTAVYQVLYVLNVTQENTGPVTISGAINRNLVTNTSEPVPAGYLKPGMAVLCIDTGTELRMLSYGDVESAVEELTIRAEAAEAAAELAKDQAQNAASDAVSQGNVPIYSTRNAVETLEIPAGINAFRTNGFATVGDGGAALYKKVDAEPSHAGKVQSADGAWWELSGPYYTVEMFGAKAGEDSTIALQAACDFISKKAVTVSLGVGTYIATDTLLIDFTSSIMGKGRLVGAGLSQSEIYTNITSGPLLHIRGDWGTSEQYRNVVKNIALRSEQNSGEGIYLEDISYPVISRVSARGFSKGLYGTDVICPSVEDCIFTHNVVGIEGNRVNHSGPNAWLLKNCTINGNGQLAGLFAKGATLTVIGGSVEGNGQHGQPDNGGFYINANPNEGASGLTATGVYFEGNGGDGDVIIDCNDNDGATHSFFGCTFNRISSAKHVLHPIAIKKLGTGFVGVNVKGCGFRGFNSYAANASRKYIALLGTANGNNYSFDLTGNYYASSVEAPDMPGQAASNKALTGAFARFSGSNANITISHNVATVVRNQTGVYTITFKQPFVSFGQCVTITPVGVTGVGFLEDEGQNFVKVRTCNMSGTAVDWPAVSVVVDSL